MPPLAARAELYEVPTCAVLRGQASATGAGAMVMPQLPDAVVPIESTTVAVNEKVPGVVGTPAMAPVEEVRDSPGGSEPELLEKVYGGTPPPAVSEEEYDVSTVPALEAQVSVKGDGLLTVARLYKLGKRQLR